MFAIVNLRFITVVTCVVVALFSSQMEAAFNSHRAMRALPAASKRLRAEGPARFVDAAKGNDADAGTEVAPWRTLAHAVLQLAPGDTLYIRGGVYYETVAVMNKAKANAPVTIRSFPGELAIIDAGFPEFIDDPTHAWEKVTSGHPDEFRSTRSYSYGGGFGNFADSMVPLHRYIDFYDLRSTNELYRESSNNRQTDPVGIYTGPGVRRDPETGRIHVRLSHTQLAGLGERAYRGETDPRKMPLVVAGHDYTLVVSGAKHVRFQDLVFRGAGRSAVLITCDDKDLNQDAQDVAFDGCTLYGSGSALRTNHTRGFRMTNCALRGHSAPWHSRFSSKNRAGAGYLGVIEGTDFEIAHCEWTDHHDCIQFHGCDELRFHHNLIDNFNDDGLEPGRKKVRGRAFIYQNLMMRTQGPFTAHGEPTDVTAEPRSGVYVYRNVIDLRWGSYYGPPKEPDPSGAFLNHATKGVLTDHGSPTYQPYYVYHNTFIMPDNSFRNYYGFSWGKHVRGTSRRVFNNMFVQVEGMPAINFALMKADDNFDYDGNLFWSLQADSDAATGFLAKFRTSQLFEGSRKRYAPGWGAHDLFADPRFIAFDGTPDRPADLRLRNDSPAIDAGVPLSKEWPDALRDVDSGLPDIGAYPLGAEPLPIGVVQP